MYGHLPPILQTTQERLGREAGHDWESKDELISDFLRWIPTHEHTSVGWPAKIYIHQLCANTGCCLENLPFQFSISMQFSSIYIN